MTGFKDHEGHEYNGLNNNPYGAMNIYTPKQRTKEELEMLAIYTAKSVACQEVELQNDLAKSGNVDEIKDLLGGAEAPTLH